MRHTDIAIVGGGLAGSSAAAMLGRAGQDAVLVDPHALYPNDFRCEKLDASQITILRKTGLAEAVARAATVCGSHAPARVVEKKPSAQLDFLYHTLVRRSELTESTAALAQMTGTRAGISARTALSG